MTITYTFGGYMGEAGKQPKPIIEARDWPWTEMKIGKRPDGTFGIIRTVSHADHISARQAQFAQPVTGAATAVLASPPNPIQMELV